jgi:hypothetical protein
MRAATAADSIIQARSVKIEWAGIK